MKCSQVLPDFCVLVTRQSCPSAGQLAGVADLAAHLGVAGAGVEDDGGLVLERDDFKDLGLNVPVSRSRRTSWAWWFRFARAK